MIKIKSSEDHRVRVAASRRSQMIAQLSEAALRVVARSGMQGATIDAVIQEAGVSRGTFYKYYDSPSALIRKVGADLAEDLIRAVSPTLARIEDPAARLSAGFRAILQLAKEHAILGRFLVNAGWPAKDHVPAFSERVGANLAAGIAQGRFNTSQAVAEALVGGILMGVLAEADTGKHDSTLHLDATIALLRGLGIGSDEAEVLAMAPLGSTELFADGLLARCRQP